MAAKIVSEYKQRLAGLTLIPSTGGCFELSIDGKLVYSKLQTGSFPDEDEMVELVGQHLS